MTPFARRCALLAAAVLIAIHPVNAELIQAAPLMLVAEALLALGGLSVLLSRTRRGFAVGSVALAAASAVAPLVAWPAFLIPLCRREEGRRRFLAALLVVLVAGVGLALVPELRVGALELVRDPVGKILEICGLLSAAVVSALAPFATPHVGTTRDAFPVVGALLIGLAIPFLLGRAVHGLTRRWHAPCALLALGVLVPIAPTLLGQPRLATTALLVWTLVACCCMLAALVLGRIVRVPARRIAVLFVLAVFATATAFTRPRTAEAFDTWSDKGRAWDALLAEDPASPYRWEYSEWLRARGDHVGARREAIRYLKGFGVPAGRRLQFALAVLSEGDEDAAFDLLKRLDGKLHPSGEADVSALFRLYENREAWNLYFQLADAALPTLPQFRLDVAEAALRAERTDEFREHLGVLLSDGAPPLRVFELGYRDLLARQDIAALDALGERAIALYPDASVGYAARGKAAKIVRRDDAMIRWHELSLDRDPDQPDLHWDLALVYHGRPESAGMAAEHYRAILDKLPPGSCRAAVEGWIADLALRATGTIGEAVPVASLPPPTPVDSDGIFGEYEHTTQLAAGPVLANGTVFDPVYPQTGDVRIQKPDLSVPSVGFPFAFWRCYRSGATYNGPLGRAWDFNFNMHLELNSAGTAVTSNDGTNRADVYTYNSGVFEPPAGRYDVIHWNTATEKWERTEPGGFKYIYEKSSDDGDKARVTQWKDTNGNVMSFSYDSTGDAAKLTKVTDTTGREYTLLYDSYGRITKLSDFGTSPRAITYQYTDAGELTLVNELDNETGLERHTTYSYQTISGLTGRYFVTTITDGKSNAESGPPFCRNYYDASSGELIVQEYGSGAADQDSPPPSSGAFLLSRNASAKTSTATDRGGTAIKFYYDDSNRITKKEWLHGSNPDTEFAYDDDNQITLITKNNGDKIHYAYDTKGNVLTSKTTDSSNGNALQWIYAYEGTYNRLTLSTDPAGVVNQYTYDGNGNLVTAKVDQGSGHLNLTTVYHYDSSNHYLLDWTDDPRGIRTAFEYNGTFQLTRIKRDPSGENVTLSEYLYDEFGNVTATKDGLGNQTTLTVNRLNQVTQVTAPSPLSYYTKFYYDRSDNLTKTEVQNGSGQGAGDFEVAMEYDLLDNLTTKIEDIATSTTRTTSYEYDLDDKLTQVTAPEGNVTRWAYNALDLNTFITVGYGSSEAATYSYAYDDNFRLIQVQEPKSADHKTLYAYDHHDRVTKVTNALGHYTTSTFTAHLLTMTESRSASDALLAKTTYAYDGANRLTQTKILAQDAGSSNLGTDGWATSTVVYDENGNVTTTKDDYNHETHFTYDALNRVSIVEDAVGSKVTFVYDANSNVITKTHDEKQEGVSGFDTYQYRFEFDNLNRMTKSYDPAGNYSTFTYDARNLVTTTDPNGNHRYFHYDELNRSIQVDVEYSGTSVITTKWEYDKNSRLTKLIDPKNQNTTYAYDALDRVTAETYADSGTRSFVYDANSNIGMVTDQNSTEVNYEYDLLNRLTQKTFSISASHILGESTQVDFAYDGLNRLTQASDTDSIVKYTYNTLSLVESEEMRYGTENLSSTGKVVEFDYDDQGLMTKCRYPGATSTDGQLEYTYDVLNRLSRLDRKVSSSATLVAKWTFKGPSRVIKKDYGNGTWVDVYYDSRANVSSLEHNKAGPTNILTCAYVYDDAGKVASEALTFYDDNGDELEDKGFSYHYDKAYRLTKLYRGVPANEISDDPPDNYDAGVEYTFDLNSNRQTVSTTPYGESQIDDVYTVNSTNSYTTVNFGGESVDYDYDPAGNREADSDAKAWYYDYQNHLVEVRTDSGADYYVQYDYDALGRRMEKRYYFDGYQFEAKKRFYYAGAALIQEYDKDDSNNVDIETEYFWGQGTAEPVYIRTYDIDDPGTLVQDGYYHQNAYGSVYAITGTDSPATLVETYRYTEYGAVTVYQGDTTTPGTPFGNKWNWQCHYYDHEVTNVASGMALYGDRPAAYDPEIGAPISRIAADPNARPSASPSDAPVPSDIEAKFEGPTLTGRAERPSMYPNKGSKKGNDPLVSLVLKYQEWINATPRGTLSEKTGPMGELVTHEVTITKRLSEWRALAAENEFEKFVKELPEALQNLAKSLSIKSLVDLVKSVDVRPLNAEDRKVLEDKLGGKHAAEHFLSTLAAKFKAATAVIGLKALGKGKAIMTKAWHCKTSTSHGGLSIQSGAYFLFYEIDGKGNVNIWGGEFTFDQNGGLTNNPWSEHGETVTGVTQLELRAPGLKDSNIAFAIETEARLTERLAAMGRLEYDFRGPNAFWLHKPSGEVMLAQMNCYNLVHNLWDAAVGRYDKWSGLEAFNATFTGFLDHSKAGIGLLTSKRSRWY